MSKVHTLLKLIAHQKEYPQASNEEIAQSIGVSPGHIGRCKKEINLLKYQLAEPTLQPGEIQFLLSLLNQRESTEKKIAQQLEKQLGHSYTGILRTAQPNEQAPLGWLNVGELIPAEIEPLDRLHPTLGFWLQNLCYDPLLVCHRNGEIEERLAIGCEAIEGNSQWLLTLRNDLRWNDGTPITLNEIIKAFSSSRIAQIITDVKPDGNTQLRIELSREEPLFPSHLRSIYVLPPHPCQLYHIISGAYRLKNFRPDARIYRFEVNRDYYRDVNPPIDWLTLRRFTHPAHAIRAIENGTLDLLSLYLLGPQHLPRFSTTVPCQQWPFFEDNYYALFLNRRGGVLSNQRNCKLLKKTIDYQAINLYLRMGQLVDQKKVIQTPHLPFDIRVAYSGAVCGYLANLIAKSTGSSVVNPISATAKMQEEADAYLVQVNFGFEYSHLSRFFHSNGQYNFFDYINLQADERFSQFNELMTSRERLRTGQQLLSFLEEDFAMILLAPCLQYTFSPLEIQFEDEFTDMIDLVQNMGQFVAERY